LQQAQLEWDKFCEDYRHGSVLPEEVDGRYTLGTYDDEGQPHKEPIYKFGPVKKRGKDLPSGRNIADYIDERGIFDLLLFFIDHKRQLESLSNVVIGQLAPHSTAEVDCESLFSEAGALALPSRSRTKVEMFERLIMGKHRLARVYCDKEKVKTEFLRRWKEKDWRNDDDRDDLDFWKQEKELFLKDLPQHEGLFEGLELNDDSDEEDNEES